jgi:dolichol-phosphate mannosyltransferase
LSDRLVIIPTYNEKKNIQKVIDHVMGLEENFHILVVDDNSPDDTAGKVKKLQQKYQDQLFLKVRNNKKGLGTAYIAGFKWALEHDYEYIFEMDADFSHNPEDLVRLYMACAHQGYDMAVGSRYITGGKVENWPLNRILLSYLASIYVRCFTFMPVRDTTAGFVCYKRSILEHLDFSKIQFIGYAFQIEMKFAAWKMGYRIKEVPITFVDRTVGESKMTGDIFNEAIWGVLQMAFKGITIDYRHSKTQ